MHSGEWGKDSVLQWRHNERYGVSNHQPRDCLLNRLFRRRSKKTSKLRVTGAGNSPVQANSPHKGLITRKNISIWWRHHEILFSTLCADKNLWVRVIENKMLCDMDWITDLREILKLLCGNKLIFIIINMHYMTFSQKLAYCCVAAHFMRRHGMGIPSALLTLCMGNPPVTDGFIQKGTAMRNFDVLFVFLSKLQAVEENSRFAGDFGRHWNPKGFFWWKVI